MTTIATPVSCSVDCFEGSTFLLWSSGLIQQPGPILFRSTLRIRWVRTVGYRVTANGVTASTAVPQHPGDIPTGTLRKIDRDLTPALGKGWLT